MPTNVFEFLTQYSYLILNALEQGFAFGIMALGVYLTYKILNFPDLTVDGSFPLGAAVVAAMILKGYNPFLATFIAMLAGAVAGTVTGLLNTKAGISHLLSGILTMTSLYSINLRIMGKPNTALLNEVSIFTYLENTCRGILPLLPGKYLKLMCFTLIALLFKLLLDSFLKTQLGLSLRATGDNPQMIRSQGVDTDFSTIIGLAVANCLVALSGGLIAQYQGFADVSMGVGSMVGSLAAVIIGETLLGERGTFVTTLGVLLGSFTYRLSISLALSFSFIKASDLRLFTAVLVTIALTTPKVKAFLKRPLERMDKSA